MRQLLLAVPLILTLFVSGCTIPGLPSGFCIPGLTCGTTVEETHDVVVIESLQALPNNVPPGGTIKLVAVVSNVADIDAEIRNVDVHVQLYDHCEGLFTLTGSSGGTQSQDKKTLTIKLLRGEKKQIEWTLTALPKAQVPVKTECTLKVLAKYPYTTKSITTLHLIDYAEMQRRINEGTYKEIGSYTSVGYGPIKPYITVEGTQPIPVEGNKINTVLSLQIKNRGRGFLSTPYCEGDECKKYKCPSTKGGTDDAGPIIRRDQISVTAVGQDQISKDIAEELHKGGDNNDALDDFFTSKCADGTYGGKTYVKLIRGESTPMPCTVEKQDVRNVPVESTKTLQASISDYWYEFRKEIKVTVEPKF
jgi:hypothetical protein